MKYTGLTDSEVLSSREKHGANEIPDSKPTTFWQAFGETFGDPIIRILMFISVLMFAMYFLGQAGILTTESEIWEPLGTITAVIIVAIVSARTSVASDSRYRELKDSTKKDTCKVYRNGLAIVINVDEVVVGDKILLQSGDKIPADGILVDGHLRVDNSALNGEAEECKKFAAEGEMEFPESITGDTFVDKHTLFKGAVVFDGEGILDVRKVGLNTMMGEMAKDMQDEEPDSPLKVKLKKLADQISMFGYIGSVVIALAYMLSYVINAGGFGVYFAQDFVSVILPNIISAVTLAIIIIVCAVPEGLPLMISLVLMRNTSAMMDHNVLVRKAVGIETAGSLNILFSDKTGTITKGMLEVVEFFTADGETIPMEKLDDHGKLKGFLDLAIGKNSASLYDGSHRVIGGNATDQALMKFLGEDTYNLLASNKEYVVDESQNFNSSNKFSQAHIPSLGKTFYKGAPERFLVSAKKALDASGNEVPLNFDDLNEKINALASRAMRVLAFGYSESNMVENQINEDVVLIGLVAIRDDVRAEAKDAIHEVQKAGIQVVMITGDRLETAVSIARDAELLVNATDIAITSADLNQMSDDEVKAIIPNLRVIARALPTDKSRMVKLCQEMNLVVGMTGDGVNDSPALKRADVGFAMGSGTEAAKEAGKIVILDDNFRSIKDAIWYGRTIYHNILKFCKFQLVINVAAVAVVGLAPFFGLTEAPLRVTHLLFVNLVMDGLGAIMLGQEPAQERYMSEKPRRRDEPIVSGKMFRAILFMGIWVTIISFIFLRVPFFTHLFEDNWNELISAYFVVFIMAALFDGFNVRDEGFGIFKNLNGNRGFMRVFFTIFLILVFIINAPFIPLAPFQWIGEMFGVVPFGLLGWLVAIGFGATMIPVDLLRKAIVKAIKER